MKTTLACLFSRRSGLETLAALEKDGRYAIACLVTHAFEPDGKTPRAEFPEYRAWAERRAVPLHLADRGSKDLSFLASYQPDFIVSVCYKYIIPPADLAHARVAALNMHRSLLPKHPGLKPLEAALKAGDKEVGLSIHRMIAQVDAGEILGQARVPVETGDDVPSLFRKIYPLHGPLLLATLDRLASASRGAAA